MATTIFAKQALTGSEWQQNVAVTIDDNGRISDISVATGNESVKVGILLPALSNLHSHSFQRAMAGLAEQQGPNPFDDFWTWRKVMYRFLEILSPADLEVIATQVQMEMLESGYAASAEFHYLHHNLNGAPFENICELSERLFQASLTTGIGYTHLPVLYMRGGLDNKDLQGAQMRFGCNLDQFQSLFSSLSTSMTNLPNDYALGVAPHSLRAVTKEGLLMASNLDKDAPIHIHIAEQQGEVDEVVQALGQRPVRWILDEFAIDKRWCFIHATHTDNSELIDFAKSGAIAGLCPITEANLGDGVFDALTFFENGGHFGIGSDSNVRIGLSEELRMLEVSQRLRDQRRVVLSSEEVPSNGRYLYERAAIGGAQALARNSGVIEVGAYADLVALDDEHYSIAGLSNDTILDTWIFASDDNIVRDVWAAGRHVVCDGAHFLHDKITSKFRQTIKRLRNEL
ncbi:MAG TPA: formimidoylglutamate deiminase [Gammaproteobacteria bacterium]|jgi:formimidoylglutamate deiminase|nr:formimidoylglutamate deiminase [Pseudomonadota bacterium]HAY46961.1 formimidoylglutamate deiminase [Gammaproteobacteria bacterium]